MNLHIKFEESWFSDFSIDDELFPSYIYFENDQSYYPGENWIDNPIIILGWWTHSISQIISGGKGQDIVFMEGPFELKLSVSDEAHFLLTSEDGVVNWVVGKKELVNELMSAINLVVRRFELEGATDLVSSLNKSLKILRSSRVGL